MNDSPQHKDQGKTGWADNPTFIRIFLGVLIVACVLSAVAGFVADWQNPHHAFDGHKMPAWIGAIWHAGMPIFFALWGFGSFVFIVLVGQHLRKLVGRKEEYYDERE